MVHVFFSGPDIFFRLADIDKLVKTNMDPIFSFRGVAREDIFRFVAPKDMNVCALLPFLFSA